MGCARKTYNECVRIWRDNPYMKDCNSAISARKLFVNNDSDFVQQNPYLKDCPSNIRDNAVRDFFKALEIQRSLEKPFVMKFRSKKEETSIGLNAKDWSGPGRLFPTKLKTPLRTGKKDFPNIDRDTRLKFTKLKEFILSVPESPIKREYIGDRNFEKKSVIALDPGCRTFLTGYDPESKMVIEFGGGIDAKGRGGDRGHLFRVCLNLDKMKSDISREGNKRKRRNKKRAWNRGSIRLRRLVDDLHRKIAKWMCENYRHIFLPKFDVKRMAAKKTRKLNSKTVRGMYTWSHGRFRQHLIAKAAEYEDVVVHDEVTEEYTSQTCICGKLTKISGKQWRCKHCGFEVDRDWLGSRNICLKHYSIITSAATSSGGVMAAYSPSPSGVVSINSTKVE